VNRRIVAITQCIMCPHSKEGGFYCKKLRRGILFKERKRLYLIPECCPLPKPESSAK
jgi:hypothetical protein